MDQDTTREIDEAFSSAIVALATALAVGAQLDDKEKLADDFMTICEKLLASLEQTAAVSDENWLTRGLCAIE